MLQIWSQSLCSTLNGVKAPYTRAPLHRGYLIAPLTCRTVAISYRTVSNVCTSPACKREVLTIVDIPMLLKAAIARMYADRLWPFSRLGVVKNF